MGFVEVRRAAFALASVVLIAATFGSLLIFVENQGCIRLWLDPSINSHFTMLRACIPLVFELSLRKGFGFLWHRCRGSTPHGVLVAVVCAGATSAQMVQLSNFLHCVKYAETAQTAVIHLAVGSVIVDVVSRTKLLQMTCKAVFGLPFRVDDLADLALRARFTYFYMLFPFVFLMAELSMRRETLFVLIVYLMTEMASDSLVLYFQYWQHQRMGIHIGPVKLWRKLMRPHNHIFPVCKGGCTQDADFSVNEVQFEEEVPLWGLWSIPPQAMMGLVLVIFPATVIFRCLEGAFLQPKCYA